MTTQLVPTLFDSETSATALQLDTNFAYVSGKVVSVKDAAFGAKGDGVSDDLSAMNAAISYMSGLGGGFIYLPVGTYLVSSSINVPSNIGLVGAGRGVATIKLKSSSGLTSSKGIIQPTGYGSTLPAVGYYAKNGYFAHFTIDGNTSGNPGGVYEGIAAAFVKGWVVDDVEAMNCGEVGFQGQVTNSGTDQKSLISFIDCVSHGNVADGFQFGGASLANCYSYSNGAAGFSSVGNYTSGATNNIFSQVVNCRAESNATGGFGSSLQAGASIRTLFANCAAYSNTGAGFAAQMNFTSITGCEASFNTSSGMYVSGSYSTISGGRSVNNGQIASGVRAGIEIAGGPTFVDISGVVLTDTQVSKTQQYALAIDSPASGANNVIRNCTMVGNAAGTVNVNNATDWIITDCAGYNPLGAFNGVVPRPANPAVGASPYTLTNNFGFPIRIFINGGTISDITVVATSSGLTSGMFVLGPGETITVTYTVAPVIFRVFGL